MYDNDYATELNKIIDRLITEFKFKPRVYKQVYEVVPEDLFEVKEKDENSLNDRQIGIIRELCTFLSRNEKSTIEYAPVTYYVYNIGYDKHDIDDVSESVSRAKNLVNFDSPDFTGFNDNGNIEYRFNKILDHLSLAFVQATEMRRLQDMIDESEENLKKVNRSFEDIRHTQNIVEEKVESIYPQFITILGIFTAIIVAFFGGVSLSNSIINHKMFNNIQLFITIGAVASIFILTMLFMLMTWIDHLLDKNHYKIKYTDVYFTAIICLAVFSIIGLILIATI